MDIRQLRKEIDNIDDQMVTLFIQRMHVATQIADYKAAHDLPILDAQREAEKLHDVSSKAGAEMETYIRALYSTIFTLSKEHQAQRNANTGIHGTT